MINLQIIRNKQQKLKEMINKGKDRLRDKSQVAPKFRMYFVIFT